MIKSEILTITGILCANEPTSDNLREAVIVAMDYNTAVILQSASGVQHRVDPAAVLASVTRSQPAQRLPVAFQEEADEPGLSVIRGGVR